MIDPELLEGTRAMLYDRDRALRQLEAECLDLVRKHSSILRMVPAVRGFIRKLAAAASWRSVLAELGA